MTPQDITDLTPLVENGSGKDDTLNVTIYAALWEGYPIARELAERRVVPNFTASLDAAMELQERLLPGCDWTLERDAAWVRILTKDDVAEFKCVLVGRGGKDTPRALLAATLRAVLATMEE